MLLDQSPAVGRPRRSRHPRGRAALYPAPPWPTRAPSWAGQLPRGPVRLGGTPGGDALRLASRLLAVDERARRAHRSGMLRDLGGLLLVLVAIVVGLVVAVVASGLVLAGALA